jgi:hypothetical protein
MVAAVTSYTMDDLGDTRTCRQIDGSNVSLQGLAGPLAISRYLLLRRFPMLFTPCSLALGSFLRQEDALPGLTRQRVVPPGQAFFIWDTIRTQQQKTRRSSYGNSKQV